MINKQAELLCILVGQLEIYAALFISQFFQAAQIALLKNSSYTGFVARQVAAYTDRFRALTVPELREEAKRRNLGASGKKQQLLARLSIWVRDEIAGIQVSEADGKNIDSPEGDKISPELQEDGTENSCDEDSSSDELEIASLDTSMLVKGCPEEDSDPDDHEKDEASIFSDKESDAVDRHSKEEGSGVHRKNVTKIDSPLHESLHSLFGLSDFRDGQEWAIKRCMEQKRTLLVAPTSFGKSLVRALSISTLLGCFSSPLFSTVAHFLL